ncbi:MAG: hypothetical protein VX090_05460 [Pseudomonadota bacterium]|nr:hypothetical protein [Pseudomonadota bacterium]
MAHRRSARLHQGVGPTGALLLLDQYSPLHAVFERAETFRDQLRQIGVDPQDRQIALVRGLFIAIDAAKKADVIARRTKARNFVDQLAEKPDGDTAASIMQFKGPEKAIDGVLIGTLNEIAERLEGIRQGRIEYLLLSNAGGGAASLRQFSKAFI